MEGFNRYILLLVVLSGTIGHGARILMIPLAVKSNLMIFRTIAVEMDARGHSVSILLHPKTLDAIFDDVNIEVITHEAPEPDVWTHPLKETIEKLTEMTQTEMYLQTDPFATLCSNMLTDQKMMQKISDAKFDIVLLDSIPFSRCNAVIPYRLGLRFVVTSVCFEPWIQRVPALPSVYPFTFSPFYTDRMSLTERIHNTWILVKWILQSPSSKVLRDDFIHQFIPDDKPKISINEILRKSEYWFIEQDMLMDYLRPTMPNEMFVGGILTGEARALPNDLQEFMDSASDGAIIVSFGSMDSIPERFIPKMAAVFEKLSQYKIVWRSTAMKSPVSSHIRLYNWIPQNDVMGHFNTKLFITHCGNNGQMEALYHGIPMLGIPTFADQHYNARRMEYHGYGKYLDLKTFTSEDLERAIIELMTNKTYQNTIKQASDIFLRRPDSPKERLVNTIELLLEHGGSHLRSYAMDMPWYEYLMLDILALALGTFCIVVILAYCFIWYCVCKCGLSSTKHKKA